MGSRDTFDVPYLISSFTVVTYPPLGELNIINLFGQFFLDSQGNTPFWFIVVKSYT